MLSKENITYGSKTTLNALLFKLIHSSINKEELSIIYDMLPEIAEKAKPELFEAVMEKINNIEYINNLNKHYKSDSIIFRKRQNILKVLIAVLFVITSGLYGWMFFEAIKMESNGTTTIPNVVSTTINTKQLDVYNFLSFLGTIKQFEYKSNNIALSPIQFVENNGGVC